MLQPSLISLSSIIGILAIIPSIIWLLFYLRKDVHPESNKMILKIFLLGMLSTIPVVLIQVGIKEKIEKLEPFHSLISFLYLFIIVAFTEELSKYLAVKKGVLSSSQIDEPLDIALYMIIGSLGFAAFENIFKFVFLPFLLETPINMQILALLEFTVYLSITSTFLHGLASGIFGFFIALSFYEIKKKKLFFSEGLFLSTFLHGIYNFYITKISEDVNTEINKIIIIIILTIMAVFLLLGLERLKKTKSICKL